MPARQDLQEAGSLERLRAQQQQRVGPIHPVGLEASPSISFLSTCAHTALRRSSRHPGAELRPFSFMLKDETDTEQPQSCLRQEGRVVHHA